MNLLYVGLCILAFSVLFAIGIRASSCFRNGCASRWTVIFWRIILATSVILAIKNNFGSDTLAAVGLFDAIVAGVIYTEHKISIRTQAGR